MNDRDYRLRRELADTKRRLKDKERKLMRIEKVLAEMAALLPHKKTIALLEDDEDD